MNGLSWLLYLADAFGDADFVAGYTLLIAGLVGTVSIIGVAVATHSENYHRTKYGADDGDVRDWHSWRAVWAIGRNHAIPVFVIAALFMIASPSRDTVYAIAASEVGEEVLSSETASKATQALNAWLDRQIAGEPKLPAE